MVKPSISLLIILSIFISCKTEKKVDQYNIEQVLEEEQKAIQKQNPISSDEITQLIACIPPPIEMSTLILNQNVNYDNKLLHDASQVNTYQNSYSQAFNLGIYGTDLGYTHLYEQPSDGIIYYDCVSRLANELKIEKFFDVKVISKLTRDKNMDSLITLTTDNFSQINTHFIDNKTPQLSIALISGGWIESTYLLAKTYQTKESTELQDKIGEQKISLVILSKLLSEHEEDIQIKKISTKFKKLLDLYDKVVISERALSNTSKESTFNEDGTMTFKSNTETVINVDKESLNQIISEVVSTRNALIL